MSHFSYPLPLCALSFSLSGHLITLSSFSSFPPSLSPSSASHLALICSLVFTLFVIPPAQAVSLTLLPLHHLLTLVHSCHTWQWIVSHWPNQNSVWGGIASKRMLAIGEQLLWSRNKGETERQTDRQETVHCSLILSAWNSWLVRIL